ncbi:TetR/AcrR family transcriptional regulator [Oceanobacter mangrovi]|uniref:TetR/AcrR family transcriptional regulator n=1 Tax=Oceanobacter mangrovi TaxID=2862510 RepID=UPI001C8DFA92|nr:TetR/AcrR family transcriptional regulator [Oceanobacter mangrovi]
MSDTRDHLKSIATDQICAKNLAAASFREMGKEAGIKSSSVHYHFKSRDALLLELIKDYQKDFFAMLDERAEEATGKQRLIVLCEVFTEFFTKDRQCMAQAYSSGSHELTPDSMTATRDFYEALYEWVLESLTTTRFLAVSRDALARVVVSAIQGALVADRVRDDAINLASVQDWLSSL